MKINIQTRSWRWILLCLIFLWIGYWCGYRDEGYMLLLWNIAVIIILIFVNLIEKWRSKKR